MPLFKKYLLAGNPSSVYTECRPRTVLRSGTGQPMKPATLSPITIKNYLSDLRYFLAWLQYKKQLSFEDKLSFLNSITPELLLNYKEDLIKSKVSSKTINRRLSTLRKFFSFCISQGWIEENPAKKVRNIQKTSNKSKNLLTEPMLEEFESYLNNLGLNKAQKKKIADDVNEFIQIVTS